MVFYSYSYFFNQSQTNQWLKYGVIFLLLVALFFVTVKQLKTKMRTKYRDLIVILLLMLTLIIGIQITDFNVGKANRTNSEQMLLFLQTAGKNLSVSKEKIAVSSTQIKDEMVIKVGDQYYEIDFNSDLSSYKINKTFLLNDQVTVND